MVSLTLPVTVTFRFSYLGWPYWGLSAPNPLTRIQGQYRYERPPSTLAADASASIDLRQETMASSRPGESNGGATGSTLPSCRKLEPFSDDAVSFFLKYDISAAAAFMSSLRHYPVMEQIEITKKVRSIAGPSVADLALPLRC